MFKKIPNLLMRPLALISNLLLAAVVFQLVRIVFVATNWNLFADHMTASYLLSLMAAGVRFDCSALVYLNSLLIVLMLLPLHVKEGKPRYDVVLRVLYVVTNGLGVVIGLYDCAYFPFTGKRTTCNVLQEFGGESDLIGIIVNEGLAYWYLLPIGLALIFLLWKGFRSGASPRPRVKVWRYYVVQTPCLAVALGLGLAGARGGFTEAVRPITMSNANQYITHSIDAGVVLNTPFCMIRSVGKKPFAEVRYMTDAEAARLFSPLHTPADTVTFRPENVVILILESFGSEAQQRGFMPFVDSLAHVGRSFAYSFANGRKSIDGMPSVLSSIPRLGEPVFLSSGSLNDFSGIAGELGRRRGYSTAFFHGAQNGSMGFEAFATATGFDCYYGRTEYNADKKYGGDADFDGTWAIWDEEFLQFFCDHIADLKEPFCTSVFTASSHAPFRIPERCKERFPVTTPPLYGCIRYSDNAVRRFFESARRQPWFERTIFVLTADHTSEPTLPEFTSDFGRYRVPIIIYAPGHPELTGVDTERIMSQTDIMPTVLGLLGYDRPYLGFGRDVLHSAPEETMAVSYLPESGYFQMVQGDWFVQYDGQKVLHAYRYKDDPVLKHDRRGQQPAHIERRFQSILQQYMHRMNHNEFVIR